MLERQLSRHHCQHPGEDGGDYDDDDGDGDDGDDDDDDGGDDGDDGGDDDGFPAKLIILVCKNGKKCSPLPEHL